MSSNEEARRLEGFARWYSTEQLAFDRKLVVLRYRAIQPWFRGRRCLELGSAEGLMTRLLLSDFPAVTAVDGASDLLATIPDLAGLTKVHSLFEDFAPKEPFDTVILDHILEHVEWPGDLLRRAATWLTPQGRLIAGVPNAWSFHRLVAVKMGLLAEPTQLNQRDEALGHRRVYCPPTLRNEIEAAGMRVSTLGGVLFKPISNKQIEDTWTEEMIEGFFQLGLDFAENAAELFAVCERCA